MGVTRIIPGATVSVKAKFGELFKTSIDLTPAKPFKARIKDLPADTSQLAEMVVTVTDAGGKVLLDYHRPDSDPGRKEYTPFTRPLEKARKSPEAMSVEELTLAGEFRLKELDEAGCEDLLQCGAKTRPDVFARQLTTGYLRLQRAALHRSD